MSLWVQTFQLISDKPRMSLLSLPVHHYTALRVHRRLPRRGGRGSSSRTGHTPRSP